MILAWLSAAIAAPRILDPGTQVRVDEVGRKDAFWRFRGDIEGLVCIVGESGMVRRPGKWWSGALGCNDGQEYFFFQVRVTPGDFGSTIRPALPEPAPPETDPEPAPPPVPLPSPFPSGTRIRLRGLGAADKIGRAHV